MKKYIVSVVFRGVEAESASDAADSILKRIEAHEVSGLNCLLYSMGTDDGEAYASQGKTLRKWRL